MKRSPLKRRVDVTREFLRRHGGKLERSEKPLKRTPLAAGKPKRRKALPGHVKRIAFERSQGLCVMCLHKANAVQTPVRTTWPVGATVREARDPHHVLPVRNFPAFEKAPDNIIALCRECHDAHEFSPNGRMPWKAIPDAAQIFCLGVAAHDGQAEAYLRRTYPGFEEAPR